MKELKTKLFYVSALALIAASCSQTEMEQLGQNPNIKDEGKGIAFIANVNSDAETRGDFEQSGNLFYGKWFADKDAIGVFYKNNTSVEPMHSSAIEQSVNSSSWMGLQENSTETQAFKFRASASGNNGYFVADSENEAIVEKESKDGEFFIHYFNSDICLKVINPIGKGKPVSLSEVMGHLQRSDTVSLNDVLVKQLVKTGTDGFVGVEGRSKDNSGGFKALKTVCSAAFFSMILGTLGMTPAAFLKSPGKFMDKMSFTGKMPTINQLKGVYGITIISRIFS